MKTRYKKCYFSETISDSAQRYKFFFLLNEMNNKDIFLKFVKTMR